VCAIDSLESDTVISYGDLLFRSHVVRDLVESEADLSVVVDSSPTGAFNRTVRDFAYCSRRDDRGLFGKPVLLTRVASAADAANSAGNVQDAASAASLGARHGRWIGILKVSRAGLVQVKETLRELRQRPDFDALDVPHLLNALIAKGAAIEVQYVHGHWRGVNDLEDFRRATDFAHAQRRLGDSEDADAAGPPGP
jgi:phosphoenolpyruvate phosphomutase